MGCEYSSLLNKFECLVFSVQYGCLDITQVIKCFKTSQRLVNYLNSSIQFYSCSDSIYVVVVLRLNVPVNNFSVMSGRSHRFLGN